MNQSAFALIIISAIMHALWNLLVKRSRHKTVFIWWMFIASSSLFSVSLPLLPDKFQLPDLHTQIMVFIGAVCFVLYHLLNGRAYRHGGDLSIIYPLCQTSMIYVPIWGITLLGERLSPMGFCGILLVILGTYSIQLRQISLNEILKPFTNMRSPSVRNALSAGFIYSIGSVSEKAGVRNYSPLYFTYILVLIMLFLMSINILRPKYRVRIKEEFTQNWPLILLSGPVMMASFLTFRYGLNLSQVSYAVPVRQVSIVIGVIIGILFLRESFGGIRIFSALLIMAGAVFVRLG